MLNTNKYLDKKTTIKCPLLGRFNTRLCMNLLRGLTFTFNTNGQYH